MRNVSGLLLLTSSVLLSGCQNSGQLGTARDEHNNMEITSTYPYELMTKADTPQTEQIAVQEPAPVEALIPSNKATATLKLPTTQPKHEIAQWQPNEGQLIRGNEIINGLKLDIGRKPTLPEMRAQIQSHMGLSALQAEQVIKALGIS